MAAGLPGRGGRVGCRQTPTRLDCRAKEACQAGFGPLCRASKRGYGTPSFLESSRQIRSMMLQHAYTGRGRSVPRRCPWDYTPFGGVAGSKFLPTTSYTAIAFRSPSSRRLKEIPPLHGTLQQRGRGTLSFGANTLTRRPPPLTPPSPTSPNSAAYRHPSRAHTRCDTRATAAARRAGSARASHSARAS